MAGSLRFRFMRMLDRRRARSTSRRILPDEERRSSLCMPAFMAAVAASECGEEEVAMLREAEGDWFREVPLDAAGEARGEGGSELISGGMVAG
jgi:hypothetical protein